MVETRSNNPLDDFLSLLSINQKTERPSQGGWWWLVGPQKRRIHLNMSTGTSKTSTLALYVTREEQHVYSCTQQGGEGWRGYQMVRRDHTCDRLLLSNASLSLSLLYAGAPGNVKKKKRQNKKFRFFSVPFHLPRYERGGCALVSLDLDVWRQRIERIHFSVGELLVEKKRMKKERGPCFFIIDFLWKTLVYSLNLSIVSSNVVEGGNLDTSSRVTQISYFASRMRFDHKEKINFRKDKTK